MLDLNHVSMTFNPGTVNEKKALTDINLHMESGEFATIVGSNGAGGSGNGLCFSWGQAGVCGYPPGHHEH